MKTMMMTTAIKQARDGKFEFVTDAKVGNNEIRRRRASGSWCSDNCYITKDDRPAVPAPTTLKIDTFKKAREALNTDEGAELLSGFSCVDNSILLAVTRGEIDLEYVVRAILAGRGMNDQGKWIGFEEAAAFWGKN